MRLHLAILGAVVTSAFASTSSDTTRDSILEVDLVFPQNKTYTPTEWFPVVFALQNPTLARYLDIQISYHMESLDNENLTHSSSHNLRTADFSSADPYLEYTHFDNFNAPGRWRLSWELSWRSCDKDGFESESLISQMLSNMTSFAVYFSIETADSVDVDLVSATSEETCPDTGPGSALAIGVPDTMDLPSWVNWDIRQEMNYTCAVTTPTTVVPDPCRVDIDRAAAESIQASHKEWLCKHSLNAPEDCPEDNENSAAAVRRAMGGGFSGGGMMIMSISRRMNFKMIMIPSPDS
ncbi:hypothetical protein BJY04DRAFT_221707 [Aspergillus karnatakaensis]|uniref:uncharacterized protein n=1 Tax=Aspergillus karnatakaensis TaxID=1810916 RepID=UPI003CCDD71F